MQGWVGRVTLCIGEKKSFHPMYFVPTLIYNFSHTSLTHGWGWEMLVKEMPGHAIPFLVFRMQWNNLWCDTGNQFWFPLGFTLVRQWEENRVLPQLSCVHVSDCTILSLTVSCLSLRCCMLFSPPCVGCERVCEGIHTLDMAHAHLYICLPRRMYCFNMMFCGDKVVYKVVVGLV